MNKEEMDEIGRRVMENELEKAKSKIRVKIVNKRPIESFTPIDDEGVQAISVLPTLQRLARHNEEQKRYKQGKKNHPLSKEDYDIEMRIQEAIERDRQLMLKIFSEELGKTIDWVKECERKKHEERIAALTKTMKDEKEAAVEEARKSAQTEAKNEHDRSLELLKGRFAEELETAVGRRERHYEEVLAFKIEALRNEMREDYSNRLREHAREWVSTVTHVKQQHEEHTEKNFEKLKVHINKQVTKLLWIQRYIFDIEKAARLRDQVDTAIELLTVIKQKELDLSETDDLLGRAKTHIRGWKEVVIDLVAQFQKFINHFLKETPGSAEYMLNLEKIIQRQLDYTELIADNVSSKSSSRCFKSLEETEKITSSSKGSSRSGSLKDSEHESVTPEEELSPEDIVQSIIEWILDKIFKSFDEGVPQVEESENVLMSLRRSLECPMTTRRKTMKIEGKLERPIQLLGEYEKENCEEGEFIDKRVKSLMKIIEKNPSVLKYIAPR